MAVRLICNQRVVGSSPTFGSRGFMKRIAVVCVGEDAYELFDLWVNRNLSKSRIVQKDDGYCKTIFAEYVLVKGPEDCADIFDGSFAVNPMDEGTKELASWIKLK